MHTDKIYQIILSILADEASSEEVDTFEIWLNESTANRDEYERIKNIYTRTNISGKEKNINPDVDKAWLRIKEETIIRKKRYTIRKYIGYAAMIAVVTAISMIYFMTRDGKEPFDILSVAEVNQPTLIFENGDNVALNDESFLLRKEDITIKNEAKNILVYETEERKEEKKVSTNQLIIPHGTTYQVVLADGTKVWLNSESKLIYPSRFVGRKREVTLIGEAFFDVTENKNQPFVIKTEGMEIEVLGTSFNVSSYSNEPVVSTTLVEGSISIKTNKGDRHMVSPSEQFLFNKEAGTVQSMQVDTELYTSWINGIYIFKDQPLEEIISKLQRWYDFTVTYEEDNLRYKRYKFTIDRKTPIDKLLEVISYTSDIKLERTGNSINIKKQGKE